MKEPRSWFPRSPFIQCLAVCLLALTLGGCESDSPTAPSQQAAASPTDVASSTWKITVTSSPNNFSTQDLAESTRATVTIQANRTSDNSPAPNNSTALLTTTAGTLSNIDGTVTGASIPVSFNSTGRASAILDVAGLTAQTLRLEAQIEGSFGDALVQLADSESTALFIESVSPNNGPPAGGTTVTIRGTGFDEPVRVLFGGLNAEVLSTSPTRLTVMTPQTTLAAGETSVVDVTVNINVNDPVDAPASDSLPNAFTYARAGQIETPTILSVSPTSGPNEGGTEVTIFGEGFADQVQVFFGNTALIEATVLEATPSRLVVRTPSATGPNDVNQNSIVSVRVLNSASGATAELPNAFQYGGPNTPVMFISAAGPNEGVYLGGTIVTIFGQGFAEPVAVEFGSIGQQPISVTGTEIVARSGPIEIVNCNRPSGNFRVVNIETAEVANSEVPFVYRPIEPFIFNVATSPTQLFIDPTTREFTDGLCGPTDPVPNVVANPLFVITGAGFDSAEITPRVIFGADVVASNVNLSGSDGNFDPGLGIGTQLTGNIPSFSGDFNVQSCEDAMGMAGEQFIDTRVNITVTNLRTGCTDTVTNIFTYVPCDTSCRVTP